MMNTVYAVAVSAFVAACFVAFPSLSPEVEASVPAAKSDRADTRPLATECSTREWPYFEAGCLRNARNPMGEAHMVRVIAADRVVRR